jgi:hypothetical protein
VVLSATEFRHNYRIDPYPGYSRNGRLYFPVTEENKSYSRKSLVLGLEIAGQFKAYPFQELDKSSDALDDEFQGIAFKVIFDSENQSARIIDENDQEIPTLLAFWFAWYAFHPDTEIYKAK